MKRSKRYQQAEKLVDRNRLYSVEEAVDTLKKLPKAKFDETIDVSVKLGVDTRKSDLAVRGSVKLPHGTGNTVNVIVFCEPEFEAQAKAGGADHVGSADLIKKIETGWTDFDYCIATPSMMRLVSRLGKVLGPRGLMPSPKNGSVTENIEQAVKEAKGGKVDFKMSKLGNISTGVGKLSFSKTAIVENITEYVSALVKARPSGAKGKFISSIFLSTTMSPSCKLQLAKEFDV